MGNLISKILAPVLFVIYSSVIMWLVEVLLEALFSAGSLLDTVWMVSAMVGLPLAGVLTGLTLYLFEKMKH